VAAMGRPISAEGSVQRTVCRSVAKGPSIAHHRNRKETGLMSIILLQGCSAEPVLYKLLGTDLIPNNRLGFGNSFCLAKYEKSSMANS